MTEIDALLKEDRRFPPSAEWRRTATVNDPDVYGALPRIRRPSGPSFARELDWIEPWTRVLEWKPPYAKWFVGGKLNVSVNCLDRHVRTARRNKAAIIWEGEPGDRRTLTYWDLYRAGQPFANVLKSLGVGTRRSRRALPADDPGARRSRCSRAPASAPSTAWSSAASAPSRCATASTTRRPSLLVTADGGYRRGQIVPLKQMADEALRDTPSIEHVVVVQRSAGSLIPVHMQEGRDHWYHRLMQHALAGVRPGADGRRGHALHPLHVRHDRKAQGHRAHDRRLSRRHLRTTKWVFDLKDDDVYWCTADIGWVTGHSYVVYGPLANGATVLMYEGAPDWPQKDRFWEHDRAPRRHDLLHRARPRSARSCGGARNGPRGTT